MIVAAGADVRERLAALAPDGVQVRGFGDPDGVEVAVPRTGDDVRALGGLGDLRLVQTMSAGTDWVEDHVPGGVTLANARGARDEAMAEWVLGALLGVFTGLLESARTPGWRSGSVVELGGRRVVILGMGSIGRAVAGRLEAFGMVVEGVGRARLGELPELLARADVLIELTPLTDATRGHVGAERLARLPDGALFVNAGRGATVDTDALLAELESGRLRAVLDVVEPEPLPDEHPLWRAPGLLALTSHWAGDSDAADERALRLVAAQLERLQHGEALENVVSSGRAG